MRAGLAAIVAGEPVTITEVDVRERAVRARAPEHALPRPGTREA
ncbi:malonyl CoA-ACP transacylase, partial [Mycobacterium rufum]|nr:malonyl CoA-ACP transacylase [Mycolicibacterium rufum]